MKSTRELTGQTFGRLTVIERAGKDEGRNVLFRCRCECGKEITTRGSSLVHGLCCSCGCLFKDSPGRLATYKRVSELKTVHGLSRTPTGVSWTSMMQRCFNPEVKSYPEYGAVGIKPCAFIKATPVNLILAIGERPSKDYSLDRINNDGGYWCGSCEDCLTNGYIPNIKWSTRTEQNRNRRFVQTMEIDGVTKSLAEWAEILNLPITTLRYRKWKAEREHGRPEN